MRGYAWKIAIIALVFCYPVGAVFGRAVTYIGLKTQVLPSPSDQVQMLKLGNLFLVGFVVFGWLIAFIAGMESMGVEDPEERRFGRFAFLLVIAATVVFFVAFGVGRTVHGMTTG